MSDQNNFPIYLVLLLSKSCSFCRELLKNYVEEIFSLNIVTIYKEDDSEKFLHFMEQAKPVIHENFPNLNQFDTITPLLLIVNGDTHKVISTVLGYSSIETVIKKLFHEGKLNN